MAAFTESVVEEAALGWLGELDYSVLHGPDIAAGGPAAERGDPGYRDIILENRFRQALGRLNPELPLEALEDAFRKLTKADAPSLIERNRAVHRMLVDGVTVEYRRKDGSIAGAQARVIDFDDPSNNDWLAVNQFTVAEGQNSRRPGRRAVHQRPAAGRDRTEECGGRKRRHLGGVPAAADLQAQIPSLFATNAVLVISDGVQARIGTLGADKEWFMPWRTITGRDDVTRSLPSCR